jgi:hypothetical protein
VRWVSSFRAQSVPTTIQAKCYLNLCEWDLQVCPITLGFNIFLLVSSSFIFDLFLCQLLILQSHNELSEPVIQSLLSNCKAAMQCDEKWYKVWHVWAIVNYRVCRG